MTEDAEDPRAPRGPPRPADLEAMSIRALGDYIAELEAEIERARRTVETKRNARHAADSVFGI